MRNAPEQATSNRNDPNPKDPNNATAEAKALKENGSDEDTSTGDTSDRRGLGEYPEVIREFTTPFFAYQPPKEDRPFFTYREWETVLRSYEGAGGRWGAFTYSGTTVGSDLRPTELYVSGQTPEGERVQKVIITTSPAEANDVAYLLAKGEIKPSDSEKLENRRCRTATV